MKIAVLGAGAFGGALASALGRERPVTLWGRNLTGRALARLPGVELPQGVAITDDLSVACEAETLLLALPAQMLAGFAATNAGLLTGRNLVACCKGVDLQSLRGPAEVLEQYATAPAVLTGPSFATDIAQGLPTALTLACTDAALAEELQAALSTPTLRLYRSPDVVGAELGGALKNVIAIAAGVTMGAGLGDSARAALMTRGYAEMLRFAIAHGARPETLSGLSGFGDLVLTCTSDLSRNFRFGKALGAGQPPDAGMTVEGVATAQAIDRIAVSRKIDMPVSSMVAALVGQRIGLAEAIQTLLTRPLKQE